MELTKEDALRYHRQMWGDMLEADGYDDNEILDTVWNVLDGGFAVSDITELCMMVRLH